MTDNNAKTRNEEISLKIKENMTFIEKLGELFFKWRDYTPIPLIVLVILYSNPSFIAFLFGCIIALIGELVRIYSVAFIGTISRTRSYSNGELVSDGPYGLLRNPLYFGNLLITLGMAISTNVWWMPLLLIVTFYTQYIPIVIWEEKKLNAIFADKYENYKNAVPNRWFPKISHMHKHLTQNFHISPVAWQAALKSEKRTLMAIAVFFVFILITVFSERIMFAEIFPLIK